MLLASAQHEGEQKERKEAAISVFCGTWNVGAPAVFEFQSLFAGLQFAGNKPPPAAEEFKHWIAKGHDVYAIGGQVCVRVYLSSRS